MSEKYRTGISLPLNTYKAGRKMATDDLLDFSAWLAQLIEQEQERRTAPPRVSVNEYVAYSIIPDQEVDE